VALPRAGTARVLSGTCGATSAVFLATGSNAAIAVFACSELHVGICVFSRRTVGKSHVHVDDGGRLQTDQPAECVADGIPVDRITRCRAVSWYSRRQSACDAAIDYR